MIKEKIYVISTEKGWIDDDNEETENAYSLQEFETLEEAKEFCKELNTINSDYSAPEEMYKVFKNRIPYYFSLDMTDKEIEEILEEIE